jgi:hypothetical protein
VAPERADRRRGAGDEGLERGHLLLGRRGLMMDYRLVADVRKSFGRYLSAEIAVDARAIDVKISRDVFLPPQFY